MTEAEEFKNRWLDSHFGKTDKGITYQKPLSQITVVKMMEAYHQSRVNAISEEIIYNEVLELDFTEEYLEPSKDIVNATVKRFKERLLKQ